MALNVQMASVTGGLSICTGFTVCIILCRVYFDNPVTNHVLTP